MKRIRAPPKGREGMRYAVILYTDTTSKEAVADFMERQRRERRRQQRRWCFIKQRLYGLVLIIFTILAGYLLFSKEMLIIDNFYWETKEREIH